ncbi:hypothetical protein [Haloparvum sedimenti]|uniref:hypothetical protein n=1 Tax=Haloparvum sedimenti TaxID=1678448 RepID=UPI00071E6B72|nr:hypothetical protein [Haloparvum sedimenti]
MSDDGPALRGAADRLDPDRVYDALAERLRADPVAPAVVAFPDGSVDYRCRPEVGAGSRSPSRRELGEAIASGERKSVRLVPEQGEPGGQAVNLARGAHALGADVQLFGHLDHDAMTAFPFRTHSMGEPAAVRIVTFEDGAVMFAEESPDIRTWGFDDLLAAAPSPEAALDALAGADAVACCNWVSFPNMPTALRTLAERVAERRATDPPGGDDDRPVFVLDPGDVVGSDDGAVAELLSVLGALSDAYDVVLNANRREVRAVAAAVGITGDEGAPPDPEAPADPAADDRRIAALREEAGISGVVMHARRRAAMATSEGVIAVRNLDVGEPRRWTGGGDRFGAGLAAALGAGWRPELALALGNAAASRHVAETGTGTPEALASFVTDSEYRPD